MQFNWRYRKRQDSPDRQIDKHTDEQIDRYRLIERQTKRKIVQTDRQTDKQVWKAVFPKHQK